MTAAIIKGIVNKNRKHIEIESRIKLEDIIQVVWDLASAKEQEDKSYEYVADKIEQLLVEVDEMDTCELARERIWD